MILDIIFLRRLLVDLKLSIFEMDVMILFLVVFKFVLMMLKIFEVIFIGVISFGLCMFVDKMCCLLWI